MVARPLNLACVAGVQRGGRGEAECERPTIALRARIQLPPSLPFVRRPRRLIKLGSGDKHSAYFYYFNVDVKLLRNDVNEDGRF